jgi:hypothetical protein
LIGARQYVLRSEWGEAQPAAAAENAYLDNHDWEAYGRWFLGLTDGANEETKARYAFRVRRFPAHPPLGADCLPLPRRRVAT